MSRRPRVRTMVDPAVAVELIKPLTHRQLCGVAFFSGITLFTLNGLRSGRYVRCQSYTLAAIKRGVEAIAVLRK